MSPATIGSDMAEPTSTSAELWARFQNVAAHEDEKMALIQELLHRYDFLSEQHKQECEDHEKARIEKKKLEQAITSLQIFIERDPFVIVLIDGDGMIFQDDLFRAGESGGQAAAIRLHRALQTYIRDIMTTVPLETKVVCRVYANVKGLADTLVRTGAVEEIGPVEDFVRGFTRGKKLFDFVDVGPGKDRADEKLIETFNLYLRDFHCRHIFFGCSHDNGYARLLEDYAHDHLYLGRITMLEGVPFEKELAVLPFARQKFPGIFRETKLNLYGNGIQPPQPLRTPAPVYGSATPTNGLPPRFPPPGREWLQMTPPAATPPRLDLTPTLSESTLNSVDLFPPLPAHKPITWASKAAAPPPPKGPTPPPVYRAPEETIACNRAGQRVDPNVRYSDKGEVDRVKKIKMCNVHFLRQECPFGDNCTHVHKYKPKPHEIETLRLVARMAPCQNGSACQDVKCIYGHRCPAPDRAGAVKGTKTCVYAEKCKFPAELHGLDTNIVKTLIVR